MKRLTRSLLQRSQQAFILSLEIFNKPTIQYRIEGFCFTFINAWELLLKARLLHTSGKEGAIYYPKKRGQPRRSLSLRDTLARVITDENDPVRQNIERIADLRDQAIHLLIPEMEAIYAGLFQAGAINFADYLKKWFERSVGDQPPLLSLVWDLKDLDPKVIQKRHGKNILQFLQSQRDQIRETEDKLSDRRFSISIEYKLVLTKKPKEADITLGTGPGGAIAGQIVEVPKDVSTTHPYTQNKALEAIKGKLPQGQKFTTFDFQAVLHKESTKKTDSKYYYQIKQTGTHCYSDELVAHIVEEVKKNQKYLDRAKEGYKRALAQRRSKPK